MNDYHTYLSHEDVRRVIPEARGLIKDISSEGEFRIYSHINQKYLLMVPDVKLDSKEATIEYFEGLNIPVKNFEPIKLNNCNALLVDRVLLETALIHEGDAEEFK